MKGREEANHQAAARSRTLGRSAGVGATKRKWSCRESRAWKTRSSGSTPWTVEQWKPPLGEAKEKIPLHFC